MFLARIRSARPVANRHVSRRYMACRGPDDDSRVYDELKQQKRDFEKALCLARSLLFKVYRGKQLTDDDKYNIALHFRQHRAHRIADIKAEISHIEKTLEENKDTIHKIDALKGNIFDESDLRKRLACLRAVKPNSDEIMDRDN